ncbi:MAG TPA: HAD-IA family hydrolase [Anaeromyxobacter sp.]|nr:HAD-IA family hydrolase [Anaeromyxobacter sp.]
MPGVNAARAILFDMDGTLVDTVPFILACVRHTFEGYGGGPTDAEWTAGIGTPLSEQLAQFTRRPEDVPVLVARYRLFWNEHHDARTRCFPGALETVSALAAGGHPLAVVTAKTERGAMRTLEHTGLARHLRAVVGSDSCARGKPHPEPVLVALGRLGVGPAQAVLLGDSIHDILSARAAGVLALGAGWGAATSEALMTAGAWRTLSDIRELSAVLGTLETAAA